jgi:hypothetical protein
MSGRSITKSSKRRRSSLDVFPPAALAATRQVLDSNDAMGLWVLLAELGVDGPAAMSGVLVDGENVLYRYGTHQWSLLSEDVPLIEQWATRRFHFIGHGTDRGPRELSDWLRGPITTQVRKLLAPAPYACHLSVGVRVLNNSAMENLVRLTNGRESLLWELTGRIGVTADQIEPHSTRRIHLMLDAAAEELLEPEMEL